MPFEGGFGDGRRLEEGVVELEARFECEEEAEAWTLVVLWKVGGAGASLGGGETAL